MKYGWKGIHSFLLLSWNKGGKKRGTFHEMEAGVIWLIEALKIHHQQFNKHLHGFFFVNDLVISRTDSKLAS